MSFACAIALVAFTIALLRFSTPPLPNWLAVWGDDVMLKSADFCEFFEEFTFKVGAAVRH